MSREWERALERQLALIEWTGTKSADLWLSILKNTSPGLQMGRGAVEEILGLADTFYVSADMVKLVGVAADEESIGDPVLERHVPFTKSGFAYFQKPLRTYSAVRETEGNQMRPIELDVQAIVWAHAPIDYATRAEIAGGESRPGEGITLLLYGTDTQLSAYGGWLSDPDGTARKTEDLIRTLRANGHELAAEVDALAERIRRKDEPGWDDVSVEEVEDLQRQADSMKMELAVSRAQLEDLELVKAEGVGGFADRVREVVTSFGLSEYRKAPLDLIDVHAWGFGAPWSTADLREEVLGDTEGSGARAVAESVGFIRRFMFALWSLMAQPIATPRSERPGRAYRRRWEQQVPTMPNYGDVRVVTLRRAVGGADADVEEGFGPEWSHRWLVRGHWRKQWYASEGVHRLIWIAPFVKGPDDKPLIIKDRVFEVVR